LVALNPVSLYSYFCRKLTIRLIFLRATSAYTECPTRHRTRHFFNDSNINEVIVTKFEQEYVRCVRNVTTL
jgi:hypothetical protein